MNVDLHSVHFSCEHAFQIIHNKDEKLWEQVIDLLSDSAHDSLVSFYSHYPECLSEKIDSVMDDGIKFDSNGMYWSIAD